jgi:hypothetical protein
MRYMGAHLPAMIPRLLLGIGAVSVLTALTSRPAGADIGIEAVRPTVVEPGDGVTLTVACGGCPPGGLSLPVSIVPVAQAPEYQPCRAHALCSPTARKPPGEAPFRFIGRTGRTSSLRFAVPHLRPGRYVFVIYCGRCWPGRRGSLISDPQDRRELLRVRASADPPGAGGSETARIWWIAAATAVSVIALVGLTLTRRSRSVHRDPLSGHRAVRRHRDQSDRR